MNDPQTIDLEDMRDAWADPSPFAIPSPTGILPSISTEGPVQFLLVSGEKDNAKWGIVGALWLSTDGTRGGFLLSPEALWHGKEMVRSYRSALSRGWADAEIYAYWCAQSGILGTYMLDPQRRAASLSEVARVVGVI